MRPFAYAALLAGLAAGRAIGGETTPLVRLSAAPVLRNGDFETGYAGEPLHWRRHAALPNVKFVWDAKTSRFGSHSVAIHAPRTQAPQWAWWEQEAPVQPGRRYRLSGYVRAKGCRLAALTLHFKDARNKTIRMLGAGSVKDTRGEWRFLQTEFAPPPEAARVKVFCALRSFGDAWFDGVELAIVARPRMEGFETAFAYACRPPRKPIVLDGRLDEWSDVPRVQTGSAQTYTAAEEIVERGDRASAASDLRAELQACYDARRLWLAVALTDNVFPCVRKPYWNGDSLQIALDLGHQRSAKPDADDYEFGFAPAGRKLAVRIGYAPDGARPAASHIRARLHRTAHGATMEIAIPWESVRFHPPAEGAVLGFSLLVNDCDGGGRKWVEWGAGIARGKHPDRFATLVLLPREDAIQCALEPARVQFNDNEAALVHLRVFSLAPGRRLRARLVVERGETRGELSQTFTTAAGVCAAPFAFRLDNLSPGRWTLRAQVINAEGQTLCQTTGALDIYPLRATQRRIRVKAQRLEQLAERARALAKSLRGRGYNIQRYEPGLALMEPLREFALYDACFRAWQPLAEKQIDDLIALVRGMTASLQACRDRSPRYVEPDLSRLTIRDGAFAAEGRPVFLCGFVGQPQDEASLPLLKKLGVNLLGFAAGPGWTSRGPDRFERSRLAPRLQQVCALAARHNCRVDVLFGHGIAGMKWLRKQYPDVTKGAGHFVDYDIDHPVMRTVWANFFKTFGPDFAGHPEILSYDLSNEPNFPRFSKRTAAKFRQWLREQYGTIDRLNAVWGMKLASFDACRPRILPTVSRGAWYDWCIFNRIRVLDFYRLLNKHLRAYDSDALVHVKLAGEVMFTGSRNVRGIPRKLSQHDDGMDREWLDAICDIHGADVRPVRRAFRSTFPAALDWQGQSMTFDFMKSIAPGKPIFDSEWHAVQTVYYESNEVPPEHMETALWLAHLHGMSANLIWWWSRRDGAIPKARWFNGSLLVQPKLMEAYCRTMLELKRLAPAVVRFAQGPRPIRLYFSRPSAIQNVTYLDELWNAYAAANFLGRGVGFLTDRQIREGRFADCRVLIVPHAAFASDAVVEGIRAFAARGGHLALIGSDNFRFDPWGRARPDPSIRGPHVAVLPRASAEQHHRALQPIVAQAAPLGPVAVLGADGRPAWGVETRAVADGARVLVYAVNVTPEPAAVKLVAGSGRVQWLRGSLDALTPRLAPLRPVLAAVRRP